MKLLALASLVVLTGCATELGNTRHAQHGADQIRMIAVQREARVQEAQAQAEATAELVRALAEVAKAAPEQAGSVAVALAVIGVRGNNSDTNDAPTVALQKQRSEALEWTKALAPTVGNLVSGLGVAAINANVQKNASDNNRDVMLGDQQQNARIVEAVAGLGSTAVANSGMSVGGSYYDLQDQAVVDQSQHTSMDTISTTTNTTSADTSTIYDASEDGFLVNGGYDYQWIDDGATYSIDIDGDGIPDVTTDEVTVDASTEEPATEYSCTPTFGGPPC
jgi:hypothetical protein